MSNVYYVSKSSLKTDEGVRLSVKIPIEENPIHFGLHTVLAKFFGYDPEKISSTAASIDYVVAAIAGCLTGTLLGALEARQIDVKDGRLTSEVIGEIENEEQNSLIIKRVHVNYVIKGKESDRETIDRVHSIHSKYCPLYQTLHKSIDISTSYTFEPS